jgi:membrane-associated phospholipid phosphatase
MKAPIVVLALAVSIVRGAAAQESTVQPPAAETVGTLVPKNGSLFGPLPKDVKSFFSTDTARIVMPFALAAATATRFDAASVEDASEHLSRSTSAVGNMGGSLYTQVGAGLGTFVIGRVTGKPQVAALGGELIRAQIVSQMFVQTAKFAVHRQRPDGSNSLSFPSGHSASAFATATVLQEHFGWKVGVPAYAFAGFVGASRMGTNKHYMSDVLVGAGIGIAAGRAVSFRVAGRKFAVGAAPTPGGGMVTFNAIR